ncbi:hypothetical protein IWQ61_007244 [Dispira simplex]|nr:hypothetical protein IWQ61_007244 [Dispira simplex]
MKISVLAFAPLGLVALLATVSASPTNPTVNTGSGTTSFITNVGSTMNTGVSDKKDDFITKITVGQVYWTVEKIAHKINAYLNREFKDLLQLTTVDQVSFPADFVDKILTVAKDVVNSEEEERVRALDNKSPTNKITFSSLLDNCRSRSDKIIDEICDALETSFGGKSIDLRTIMNALNWEFRNSQIKVLIDDHDTIMGYFQRNYPGKRITKDAFIKEFSNGIVGDNSSIELLFEELDSDKNKVLNENDRKIANDALGTSGFTGVSYENYGLYYDRRPFFSATWSEIRQH